MNHPKLITILSIAVAVLFVSVLFLLYLNYQKPVSISISTGVLPTTIPVNDSTANWKTYHNDQYSFEFQYPPFYELTGVSGGRNIPLVAFKYIGKDADMLVSIDTGKFSLTNLRTYAPTGLDGFDPTSLTLNNNVFYYYGPGGGGVEYPDIYFYNLNGKILIFNFFGPYENDKSPTNEMKTVEKQILSTFKFTQSQAIPQSISDLFSEINKLLSSNMVPTPEDQFYSNTGMVNEKSWKLDLTGVKTGKLTTFLLSKLQMNNLGGSAGANNIDGYENDQIVCIHASGNSTGSPLDNSGLYHYLSCTEK